MNATKQRIKLCVYDECLLIFDTHANTYNTCIYQINEWMNEWIRLTIFSTTTRKQRAHTHKRTQ